MRLISAPWFFVVRVYAQTSATPIPGTEPNEMQQLKESHPSHNLSTSLEAPQPQFLDPAQQLQQQAQLGMAGMSLASPGPLLTPTAVLERAAQQRRLRQLQREQATSVLPGARRLHGRDHGALRYNCDRRGAAARVRGQADLHYGALL